MTLVRMADNYFRMIRMRMGMEKKHFLEGLIIGLFIFSLCVFVVRTADDSVIFIATCGVNALFFPLSRRAVENVVFHYTGKGFWGTAPLRTGATNGGHVLLWLFYFVFAIPLGAFYLMWLHIKK